MLGTYALSAGYYDAYYGKAQQVRTLIQRDFDAAYGEFDLLCRRRRPTTAFELGAKTADPLTMYLNDVYTIPSNLAGHPAISVPFGRGDDGLPVGVQLLGPALSEAHHVAGRRDARGGSVSHRRRALLRWPTTAGTAAPRLGDGDRAGGPRRAGHRHEAVLRVPQRVRRRAQHQHLPGLLGLPGSLPVLNERAVELALRAPGPPLRERRRSSPGRTTSIRTCRRTTRSASTTSPINVDGWLDLPDGTPDRHRAGPPRGGHRQVDPRGRRRADPRGRVLPGRLQPGRRAAAWRS